MYVCREAIRELNGVNAKTKRQKVHINTVALGPESEVKKRMDYKAVIEEQIRELQKVQDGLIKGNYGTSTSIPDEVGKIASTIAHLCNEARMY